MMFQLIGCSFRSAPVGLRECLAFSEAKVIAALDELVARYGCEAVILSTCNRVELYLAHQGTDTPAAKGGLGLDLIAEFLAEFHGLGKTDLRPYLYHQTQAEAIRHLFRVSASLDSLIVGEGQIAGQVKQAYELAQQREAVGPYLHALFQQARQVAKRVRTETGIAQGHLSVASVAVDYVRQVFETFDDKTVLVIGAGKMGGLTLKHLRELRPRQILVTNRSPEKAVAVATGCGGAPVPWEHLDDALATADIVLSTTGAPEPIVTLDRYARVAARRTGRVVILDIAVPRDFDPRIHDGDQTCLVNVDDLKQITDQTRQRRVKHLPAAEGIVEQEQRRFVKEWRRRKNGPVIARLTRDLEDKRQKIVRDLMARLNGKLTSDDRAYIEGAFRLLQNQFLHGPISALTEEPYEPGGLNLLDALRKLFRLTDLA